MSNKKILNAKEVEFNNIKFRSKLERYCYRKLLNSGLEFSYEEETFILWEGFRPTITVINNFYSKGKRQKKRFTSYENPIENDLYIDASKFTNITYTPDFIINHNGYKIILEAKGNPNDVYPYKKKLFLKTLEDYEDKDRIIFAEIRNQTQIDHFINYIKDLNYELDRQD